MKKLILSLCMIMTIICGNMSFATNEEVNNAPIASTDNVQLGTDVSEEPTEIEDTEDEKSQASDKIIGNKSKKDRKIAEYMDKYNDKTYAYTAYVLDLIRVYSIPVCIIGLTWGAFNFSIIGEKKLDKREQGFSHIMAFLCGLVVFQVLPLVFALLVAGK